ncbi:MAG: peptidyl-prolyl cis-trans isomerase [Acidobacteriota bacterium]|nr:peptidyl-prolyl cis-trans isomerase [Acidobacteriota bacterium]
MVLRVNDQIATLFDYRLRKDEMTQEFLRREMPADERGRQLAQLPEVVYRDMFEELLLSSRADQLGIEVTTAQVDSSVAQMRQNFGIKTDEAFLAALAQQGLSVDQLRAQLKSRLRINEVMGKEVQGRIKTKEDDLRRYYRKNLEKFRQPEQVELREVVVLEEGNGTPEQRAQIAADIRQAVAGGKSLSDAAARYTEKSQASSMIDFGWVSPGDLDPGLEAAAWKLEKGAVSEPVKARGGLHLLQVIDRRQSRILPFPEVQAKIQAQEQERLYREETAKYMAELEQRSLIVADPPPEAAGFRRLLGKVTPEGRLGEMEGAAATAVGSSGTVVPSGETKPDLAGNPQPGRSLPPPKPVDTTPPSPGSPPPPGVH